MAAPRILFLDDDHVLRIFRLLLRGHVADPALATWFAPEVVDLHPVVAQFRGLMQSDGAVVGTLEEEPSLARDADAMVFRRGTITEDLLAQHPRLAIVARLGERTEGIDLAAAARRQVRIHCPPRPTIYYTAEHALLLMLACAKRLIEGDATVRRGAAGAAAPAQAGKIVYNWPGFSRVEGLHGRTLGLVGLGGVGALVARLAVAFGMTVIYTKPNRATPEHEHGLGVRYCSRAELLAASDFVSLHVPVTPDTTRMVDRAFLAAMKPGAFLINTSRGSMVDEDALHAALLSGHLGGAGLDVHATEPRPAGDRFAALPNVVLTPHNAGGARSGVLAEFVGLAAALRASLAIA